MMTKAESITTQTSELSYLELLAALGMTRHLGGWQASNELASACCIRPGQYILDVGCGVGRTAAFISKQYYCRVMGIDRSARMIEWASKRVWNESVADLIDLKVADAQQLPFEDGLFDVVLTESVLAFVPDRRKALSEFMRVTKPGGYIGLNESCWLQTAVPPEVKAFLSEDYFSGARLETAENWKDLLAASGLKDIKASIHHTTARGDVLDRIKWFGLKGMLANLYHILLYCLSSPSAGREFRRIMAMLRNAPKNLYEYYGYGIYVSRK